MSVPFSQVWPVLNNNYTYSTRKDDYMYDGGGEKEVNVKIVTMLITKIVGLILF